MASIDKRPGGRWRARWREYPGGPQRTKAFIRKVDAERFSRYVRRAANRADLTGRTWHDLRHHHASVLLSNGVSPALVAERLGHDVGTLLKTYAHVIRNDDDRVRASSTRRSVILLRTG